MSDLTVYHEPPQALARQSTNDIFSLGPKEMVAQATEIANVLKDVIKKQGLYSNIQGREYVKAEGWSTLGTLLGILPRERSVVEHADGSFEAVVELYSLRSAAVVGVGSALCGKDEKRWATADRYARRSMAITRATGKAYRLAFSWIVSLAGYEATPAEEMNYVEDKNDASRRSRVSIDARNEQPAPSSPRGGMPAGRDDPGSSGETFSKEDPAHLEKLEKILEKDPSISKEWYLEIAGYLDGKEIISKSNIEKHINQFVLDRTFAS